MDESPSHLDERGRARMVDVGAKPPLRREAVAEAIFRASPSTLDRLEAGDLPKGEALAVARVAGIQAAKRCDEMIPLCHPLPLDGVRVDFERRAPGDLRVEVAVTTTARTGVEMEALLAASAAALCLYDMAKSIDSELLIERVALVSKRKQESRK